MAAFVYAVQGVLETLGGTRPLAASWSRRWVVHVAWGLWWALLLLLAIAFGGRGTKFVYVDF